MSLIVIHVSEVALFLFKKTVLLKKAPPTKTEGFQMFIFVLNQTCQTVFTGN